MKGARAATGAQFGFGVYVHWPYCTRICPYCDFNVYAAKDRDTGPLVDAICADLRGQHARFGATTALDTVYFGGGTPSLIGAAGLARILGQVERLFGWPGRGVTLETNPLDVSMPALLEWKALGINRLSLGVQSLCDDALAFLGRDHSAHEARRAAGEALSVFEATSLDLIYARPGQGLADWEGELAEALALGAPHLSLYELTIEERTAFGRRAARGQLVAMDDDSQADLYEITQALCETAGLPAYEVSNHARGPEWESRHNHIYWCSGDWIGVGPGAHGRLTRQGVRIATEAARRVAEYIEAALAGQPAVSAENLSNEDALRELVAMGLRPVSGLGVGRIEALGGRLDEEIVSQLRLNGLLESGGDRISLTTTGRLLADYVTRQVLP